MQKQGGGVTLSVMMLTSIDKEQESQLINYQVGIDTHLK